MDNMSTTETRLFEIRSYVDSTRIPKEHSCLSSKDLLALGTVADRNYFDAILLAFSYGRAKGYQAGKEVGTHRASRSKGRKATATAERVSG